MKIASGLCRIWVSTIHESFDHISLRFNISNKLGELKILHIYLITDVVNSKPIPISNFILVLKGGESEETLTLKWDKLDANHYKVQIIEFLFVTTRGNITSNSTDIN